MKLMKNQLHKITNLTIKNKLTLASTLIVILAGSSYVVIKHGNCKECIYKDSSIKITKQEFNEALKARQTFYTFNNQTVDENILNKDTLNQLKEDKKIAKLAKDKNITVSSKEIDALYKERIKQNETEEKLLEKVNNMYGYSKDEYLKVLEKDILLEKVESN